MTYKIGSWTKRREYSTPKNVIKVKLKYFLNICFIHLPGANNLTSVVLLTISKITLSIQTHHNALTHTDMLTQQKK
jgi:hypothetical protein